MREESKKVDIYRYDKIANDIINCMAKYEVMSYEMETILTLVKTKFRYLNGGILFDE